MIFNFFILTLILNGFKTQSNLLISKDSNSNVDIAFYDQNIFNKSNTGNFNLVSDENSTNDTSTEISETPDYTTTNLIVQSSTLIDENSTNDTSTEISETTSIVTNITAPIETNYTTITYTTITMISLNCNFYFLLIFFNLSINIIILLQAA